MIENEEQYQMFLTLANALIVLDPILGGPAGDMLEHVASLIEDYEKSHSSNSLV